MRRTLLALSALLVASPAAFAADLGARPVYKAAPPAMAPFAPWTGLYIGGNLGGGWADASADVTLGGATLSSGSETLSGVVGGGQIGYNWQFNNWLLGVEADFQGTSQSHDFSGVAGGLAVTGSDKLPWFGTVRGRLGLVWDRWLVYGTGGFAYANLQSDVTATFAGVTSTTSISDTRTGYAVGGGIETMLWDRWSGKIEYLYIDTGTESTNFGAAVLNTRVQNNVVRAGLNYHF
ncbi:MAG: outer membrane protein [Pseudorhodoplanes sp.]